MQSFKESVEQIDELSKGTLAHYVNNAAVDAAVKYGDSVRKISKPDATPESGRKEFDKSQKRLKGVRLAAYKMAVKEDVEQIDELSKKTLGRYIKKAGENMASHAVSQYMTNHSHVTKKKHGLAPSKYLKRYGKRRNGISNATAKLTKEEVEQTLEMTLTNEQFQHIIEASRMYSLAASDKHVNLAQDAEHRQDWHAAKKHWKNAALASIKHDATHGRDRSDKLKVRGYTTRKEEVEPINELSNTTKTRYIKKAKASSHGHHVQADYHVGRMNAGKKGSTKSYYRHMDKASKRMKGIDNAKASMEAVELAPSRKATALALIAKGRQTKAPASMVKKK